MKYKVRRLLLPTETILRDFCIQRCAGQRLQTSGQTYVKVEPLDSRGQDSYATALAAMGRRVRYENSTTMRQRGAGNTVRACAFSVQSIGATSVQVCNCRTTLTRLLRGSTTVAQPGYHCTSATQRVSSTAELRCTLKWATGLRHGGMTTLK